MNIKNVRLPKKNPGNPEKELELSIALLATLVTGAIAKTKNNPNNPIIKKVCKMFIVFLAS